LTNQLLNKALVQLLKDGQQVEVPASGLSMFPLLRPGDNLVVKPQLPQIGDIGVFSKHQILIAHRLINTTDKTFYFKGDALINPDSPTSIDDVLGTVVARKRGSKVILISHPYFKLFKRLIPVVSFFTGRLFFYCSRIQYKLHYIGNKNLD
jgi:hypothetical protein